MALKSRQRRARLRRIVQWQSLCAGWTHGHPCVGNDDCFHLACDRCGADETKIPGAPMPLHRCPLDPANMTDGDKVDFLGGE